MKDDFLYQFRKQPRVEFATNLWPRIMPAKQQIIFGKPALRRLAFGLAAVSLVFTLLFSFSAGARATFGEIIEKIGGLMFMVTDQNELMSDGEETVLTEQVMSISEARAILPFELRIPTWAPEGFELRDQVSVVEPQMDVPYYLVTLEWIRASPASRIELRLAYQADGKDEPSREIVGPSSIEEVQVNGQPAVLVSGAWNYDTGEYDPAPSLKRLNWYQDHIEYTLFGVHSTVDLIRMAESLP